MKSKHSIHTTSRMQRGFTLVELTVVMLIVAVLIVLSFPRVKSYIVEGKVSPTGSDMVAALSRIRSNAEGAGNTPYAALTTASLANAMRDRTTALVVTGVGAAATLQHKIGATNSQVTVAPATITAAGDSFTVTFPTVNAAACPGLSNVLQNSAEIISINGQVVKSIPAPAVAYDGSTAQNQCTADDTNTFVFTVR